MIIQRFQNLKFFLQDNYMQVTQIGGNGKNNNGTYRRQWMNINQQQQNFKDIFLWQMTDKYKTSAWNSINQKFNIMNILHICVNL